jgi:hypothetical protein
MLVRLSIRDIVLIERLDIDFSTGLLVIGAVLVIAAGLSGLFHGTVPDVEGGEIDLSAFAGRDVAVWFWAPW